jgi:hypothetical protein
MSEREPETEASGQTPHPDQAGGGPVEDELNQPTRESMELLGRADLDEAPDPQADDADDRHSPPGQNSDWLPQ